MSIDDDMVEVLISVSTSGIVRTKISRRKYAEVLKGTDTGLLVDLDPEWDDVINDLEFEYDEVELVKKR